MSIFKKEFEWHSKLVVFILSVAKYYMCLTQPEIKRQRSFDALYHFSSAFSLTYLSEQSHVCKGY